MGYQLPPPVTGALTHITDHNSISDVLAALDKADPSLFLAPAGATAITTGGREVTGTSGTLTSGTVYLRAIAMKQGTVVSNITLCTRGTGEAGGSHAWYVLTDSSLVVKAVSADATGAAALGATQSPITFPVNPYTTAYSGLFYIGVCCVASTMPNFLTGATPPPGLTSAAPVLCGSSSTGQTTPPAPGSTLAAIVANNGFNFFACTS